MREAPLLAVEKIERNLQGLVNALFDELDAMRAGTGSAEKVRAVCIVAGRINSLLNTEMNFRKQLGKTKATEDRVRAITG
jgi:hypothetical protein